MPPGSLGTKLEHYETSYMEYLESARVKVQACMGACQCWCYAYDGDNPSPEILAQSASSSASDSIASTPVVTPAIEIKSLPGDTTPTADTTTPVADEASGPIAGSQKETSSEDTPPHEDKVSSSEVKNAVQDSGVCEVSAEDNVEKLPVIRDNTGKVSHVKNDSSADSVISEADSALSGSSYNTETAQTEVEPTGSRSDSPLNDDFDSQDFNAFLLSLKRVKTPVEFCDSIEESIQEFEELLNSLKLNTNQRICTSDTKLKEQSGDDTSEALPKFVNSPDKDLVKPNATNNSESDTQKSRPASAVELTEFDKEISKKASVSETVPVPIAPASSQSKPNMNTPLKYSTGAPNIGKFAGDTRLYSKKRLTEYGNLRNSHQNSTHFSRKVTQTVCFWPQEHPLTPDIHVDLDDVRCRAIVTDDGVTIF